MSLKFWGKVGKMICWFALMERGKINEQKRERERKRDLERSWLKKKKKKDHGNLVLNEVKMLANG